MTTGKLQHTLEKSIKLFEAAGSLEGAEGLRQLSTLLDGPADTKLTAFVNMARMSARLPTGQSGGMLVGQIIKVLTCLDELLPSKSASSPIKSLVGLMRGYEETPLSAFVSRTLEHIKDAKSRNDLSSAQLVDFFVERLERSYQDPAKFQAIFSQIKGDKGVTAPIAAAIASKFRGAQLGKLKKADAFERIEEKHVEHFRFEGKLNALGGN